MRHYAAMSVYLHSVHQLNDLILQVNLL